MDRVEVALGHLGDRLDVPGVLRDQRDDGGQHQQAKFNEKLGAVNSGRPIQSAAPTPSRFSRSWAVASVAPPSTEVIGPAVTSSSTDSR